MSDPSNLPGFMTPDSPKADLRLFALPGGSIDMVLLDDQPLDAPMPPYEVLVSTEYGREVILQARIRTGHVFTLIKGNKKQFILRVGPPEVKFAPATYIIRAMVNDKEVLLKTVTVLNHPALP